MPGYDWTDSSGNVDASSSGYNYSTGTSYGVSNNSSSNNSSNNYYSNPDAGYDDSWESQPNNYVEPYTPPNQVYGPGTATPGETGYAFTKANPKILEGIDPKILSFFGYEGGSNIPVELLKMIMEGSIMGGPEAGNAAGPTYSDIEKARINPNNPYASFTDFYDQIMRQSNLIDITQSGGGGSNGGGRGGWSGSWGGPGGFGSGIGGAYSRRWNPHMKNVNNYNSPIAQVLAQRRANPVKPQNQFLFTELLRRMPGGGITEAI